MKLLPLVLLAAFVAPLFAAGSDSPPIAAAMKLVESKNYSWSTTWLSSGRSASPFLNGKMSAAGYAEAEFIPSPGSSVHREMAALNGGKVRGLFLGRSRSVFETRKGWFTPDELTGRELAHTHVSRTLRFFVDYPHDAVALIVSAGETKSWSGNIWRGTLPESAVQYFVDLEYGPIVELKRASVDFSMSFAGGELVQIEVTVTGTAYSRSDSGPFERVIVYHISDISATQVDVPAEAKKKLDR